MGSSDHVRSAQDGRAFEEADGPGRGHQVRRAIPSSDLDELAREIAGLRQALASRNIIGQAQGILIERQGTDADGAFQILVRLSQQSHMKLHAVARRLVSKTIAERQGREHGVGEGGTVSSELWERPWVVHIVDVREIGQVQRCVRCDEVLDVNQLPAHDFGAGRLLAIRHGQDRTEWRPISSRDDLLPDEVACDEETPEV